MRNPNPNPAVGLFFPCSSVNPWYEYVPFSVNQPINPPFRQLKFTEEPRGISISQSCNGLLLCCSFLADDRSERYYVYNPTTGKFSTLPELNRGGEIHGMRLAFDPAKSPYYKVVCVRGLGWEGRVYRHQLEIYSSETGTWRKWSEPFTAQVNFINGVYWNGAIHWISDETGNSLYFNLDHQTPQIMPMPPIPDGWDWRSKYYFGESCDHLHYIELFGAQIQFNVYEMKRDYSEWFVKYQVDLSPVVAAYPEMIRGNFDPTCLYYYAFSIFTMVRGEKDEDSFLVLQIPGKAVCFNLVDMTFETLFEFAGAKTEGSLRFPSNNGFQHIESLCCV